MQSARPVIALDPRCFGRGRVWRDPVPAKAASRLQEDLRLFGTTFLAGFLFVALIIA